MHISTKKTKFLKHFLSSCKNVFHSEKEIPQDIFTLPNHALPSQYKTLLPMKDAEIEKLLSMERRRRIIRNATLAITSIIVVFIIIVFTLIIVLQLSLNEEARGPLRLTVVRVNRTQFKVHDIQLLKSKAMVKSSHVSQKIPSYSQAGYGMQCISKCWEYAAFRFKAECVDGRCLCRDYNYDSITCLPKTSDCEIRKHPHHPSFKAIHHGQIQTSYSCAPKKDVRADVKANTKQFSTSPEIHVISLYGDRNIKFTRLHFKSTKKINATLVLVSYEPMTWNITLDESVNTETIFLISHYGVSRTSVNVFNHQNHTERSGNESPSYSNFNATNSSSHDNTSQTPTEASPIIPYDNPSIKHIKITKLLIRTGYGDDRDSGSTPFLLNQITTRIGPISSFFGVAYADDIEFDIGLGNYELSSTSQTAKGLYETSA